MSGEETPEDARAVQRDLVLIGASAGGVDALCEFVGGLQPEFPAAIVVVLHVASSGTSVLPEILSRSGRLPAKFAVDGEQLERGQIYVAPGDHHLLVHDRTARVTHGPRENGHRPAVDPLFRSAGRAAGARAIGVVLSGMLDDGASGLHFLKRHGGIAVVQDPDDAQFPGMPRAAIQAAAPQHVVPIAQLAATVSALVEQPVEPGAGGPAAADEPLDLVEIADPAETRAMLDGPPSTLTCPECGGSLWEHESEGVTRYTCHVGHAYSVDSLAEEQGNALEVALWSALRSLEERADMQRRLARRTEGQRRDRHEERALEAQRHAQALREMLGRARRLGVAAAKEVA